MFIMRLILASASPRRKELLSQITTSFTIIPAKGEEVVDPSLSPDQVAESLAQAKCNEVFIQNQDAVVIGCDTIVVFQGAILGKPKSVQDAVSTLTALSGNTHQVITGLCIQSKGKKIVTHCTTQVRFNTLSADFIRDYVATGSPMDKAGSYGIQDGGLVADYQGSYTNVIGFPVEAVKQILSQF